MSNVSVVRRRRFELLPNKQQLHWHNIGPTGRFSSSASCLGTFGDVDCWHEDLNPQPFDHWTTRSTNWATFRVWSPTPKCSQRDLDQMVTGWIPEDLKTCHTVWRPHQVRMSWATDASCTFSLGRRLMVLRGRSTRRTLSDLMVLMSLPFVPLRRWKEESDKTMAAGWGTTVSLWPIQSVLRAGHCIPGVLWEIPASTLLVEGMHVDLSCLFLVFYRSMQLWRWLTIQSCSSTFTPVPFSFCCVQSLQYILPFSSFQIYFCLYSLDFSLCSLSATFIIAFFNYP